MALESVVGNLQTAYRQIEPGTMQPAAAIQVERHTNEAMRDQWFHTADGPLYYKGEGREIKSSGNVMLAITPEKGNLVLLHLEDRVKGKNSFVQLTQNGNYFPNREEAAASILAIPQERIVDLTQVRLKGTDNKFRYLEIDTSPKAYTKLNAEEQKLASVYYGSMEPKERADIMRCEPSDAKGAPLSSEPKSDFELTMAMLHEQGIKKTRVYVVAPDYVVEQVSEQKPVIARASVLYNFSDNSFAGADFRYISGSLRVRGVRRVVVEAVEETAPEGDDLSQQRLASQTPVSNGSLETLMQEFKIKDKAEVRKAFEFYTLNRDSTQSSTQ